MNERSAFRTSRRLAGTALVLMSVAAAVQKATDTEFVVDPRVHRRYSLRRSCIITTNRVIDDWSKCLGDAALTTAILDRLLHRSIPVEFRGRS
jgi:DNA replication protein DnaC